MQSPERLRLLVCLTVADIRAVGPGRWNNWKATLLRELYRRAEALMDGGSAAEGRDDLAAAVTEGLRGVLSDWPDEAVEAHLASGHPAYWLSYDAATLERHARFIRETDLAGLPLAIDRRVDTDRAVTEITIYTADHPGLFSRIAGALAVSGANIVDAKIHTLNSGMALDSFLVQDADGGAFARPDKLAKLAVLVEQTLSGRLRPLAELQKNEGLPSRTRVFRVAPRVLIDNKASNRHTVIEVNGRDRPGLLYAVTGAFYDLSLQVYAAKISTYGEQVVDVFYVKDVFGLKIEHPAKLDQIRGRLLEALKPIPAASRRSRRRRGGGRRKNHRRMRRAGNRRPPPAKENQKSKQPNDRPLKSSV